MHKFSLHLYETMRHIDTAEGCELLYTDTDSVIYSHPVDLNPIVEGDFLGELSVEYGDSDILEFVCGGAKQVCSIFSTLKVTIVITIEFKLFSMFVTKLHFQF
jgi:hypothetical protein